jgi:hypothetical protein
VKIIIKIWGETTKERESEIIIQKTILPMRTKNSHIKMIRVSSTLDISDS